MEPAEYQRMFELEDHHWWFQGRLTLVETMLARYAGAGTDGRSRMLDIGCGTGMLLGRQSANRWTAGLDFSLQALGFTKERGIERLVCADSQYLPFASDSFDVLTAFDLIEHVEGDRLIVAEAHRVLRPGGILLATVPAHPWLWSRHDLALHHKRRYRLRDFDALFEPELWTTHRLTYAFSAIYPFAATIRSIRKLVPPKGPPRADTVITGPRLNAMLKKLHVTEAKLLERYNAPFGLSILTVREKR